MVSGNGTEWCEGGLNDFCIAFKSLFFKLHLLAMEIVLLESFLDYGEVRVEKWVIYYVI